MKTDDSFGSMSANTLEFRVGVNAIKKSELNKVVCAVTWFTPLLHHLLLCGFVRII